ncbi:hypothetical protein WMF26_20260 [Sorangium sp. So ce185]|uniref:hypothetical protein n=1 Tax=Sorangium sp. So ce185 TaxID=3133287 RepID=UPI003F5DFF9C
MAKLCGWRWLLCLRATTQIPTSHGMLVRAAYAEERPEVVVGLPRAIVEADRIFEGDPERQSELIEHVTGVGAEVADMSHGPLGRSPHAASTPSKGFENWVT